MRTPTTNSQVLTARVAGMRAARKGQSAAMCPYPHFTLMALEWLKGWVEVKNEQERSVVLTDAGTHKP